MRPASTPAERPLSLLPVFVDLDKDKELREKFLLDAAASGPALEGVASKLHKEMGLQQEESRAEIKEILAGQTRMFSGMPAGGVAAAPQLVKIQIKQELDTVGVFVDLLVVDLNAPPVEVDAYFAAVCRDFGIPHVMFLQICKTAHARIAAARAQVAAGQPAAPAPDPGAVVRGSLTTFPTIVPMPMKKPAAVQKAGAPSPAAAALAPVKAEAKAKTAAQPAVGSVPEPADRDMPDF